MNLFVTLVAALPMLAAVLPMFVSLRAAVAGRHSHGRARSPRLIAKSATAVTDWR